MIEKTLAGMFKVVTDEAATNPAFGRKLEDQLAKFGQDLAERRLAEKNVGEFHPLIEYKKGTPQEFETRLMKFDAKELRVIIDRHHLDPAATLKLDAGQLGKFPEGYRHLAYLQSRVGFTVKGNLPGLRGEGVERLYAGGKAWLAGSARPGNPL